MRVITKRNSGSGEQLRRLLANIDSEQTFYWGVTPPPNHPNSISCGRLVEGVEQLRLLSEKKVATPIATTNLAEATEWAKTTSVWGRLNNHTQGKDIRHQKHREWSTREYWVKQIPSAAIVGEWRLHVFGGLSIARGKKTQTEIISRKLAPVVRSRRNGWRLQHTDTPPQGAKFYAKLAVEALGYLWGAVDMLEIDITKLPADVVTNHDRLQTSLTKSNLNPFVVLEVNQMPGMDDYTATQYAAAIQKHLTKNPAR